ncbi:serine hydrolase domain-containing protein [Paenibacillus rhizoplanae]
MGKGYGSSNLEQAAPVDPATSMFRIASTTKLFTWTAVMQLVEQGQIDLDTDINTYLKSVKIPCHLS